MNIGSGLGYPSSHLSNFHPYKFIFRGVECNSMEGLLQSFKFDKTHIQQEVCKLVGITAKRRGQARNKAWKTKQVLWWDGKEYPRKSPEYQALLDDAYKALATNDKFCKALLATGDAILRHSIGSRVQSQTVLTENEFCNRLEDIRDYLKNNLTN